MHTPASPRELIAILRRIAERSPSSADELRTLQDECGALMAHISTLPALSDSTPHIVWHFLSDADIRFKDPRYAKAQLEGLAVALSQWEHQAAA